MKYIGAIFIMCGCVTLSYLYEKREKNKITYLHKMKDFISYIKSKINFFLTPLNTIFSDYDDEFISNIVKNKFENLDEYYDKNDLEFISCFFTSIGKGIKDEEISLCDYTLANLETSICEAEKDFKNKVKVFRTLAIFCGASVVILII